SNSNYQHCRSQHPTPFPYPTLFRSEETEVEAAKQHVREPRMHAEAGHAASVRRDATRGIERAEPLEQVARARKRRQGRRGEPAEDRKSTRLNSSHVKISYAVFCLKK